MTAPGFAASSIGPVFARPGILPRPDTMFPPGSPGVPREGSMVMATGTSCRSQIADLAPRRAEHPLVFLAGRLEPG
ncbi:MAG: hypothetical protein HY775_04325 [Acidobacteria bacterium]|nr:hypothetical protein [Acidobacteriota bacterium]